MTKLAEGGRCRWCGRRLSSPVGSGRPRQYCRPGCRQQAHVARKLAAVHGLGEDDVIVDRAALEELQGALYCLEAAVEDVDRDLAGGATAGEVAGALQWLLENARPLVVEWRVAAERLAKPASPP